jgi:hypothetical protein
MSFEQSEEVPPYVETDPIDEGRNTEGLDARSSTDTPEADTLASSGIVRGAGEQVTDVPDTQAHVADAPLPTADALPGEPLFVYERDPGRYTRLDSSAAAIDGRLAQAIARGVRMMRDNARFEGQTDHTDAEKQQIATVYAGFQVLGGDLRLPLADRLPPLSDWRPFATREDLDAAAGKLGEDAYLRGFQHVGAGILWMRDDDPVTSLSVISHQASAEVAVIQAGTNGDNGVLLSSGYALHTGKQNSGLDDICHEIAAGRIQRTAGNNVIKYTSGTMATFGHAVVEAVASRLGAHPTDIENILLQGVYSGDHTQDAVDVLTGVFGKDRVNQLANLDPDMDDFTAIDTAVDLDLIQAAELIISDNGGQGCPLFEWPKR